jgi:hypothetical protein
MPKLKIILALSGTLILAGIAPGTADDASWSGRASATIQATAHVAPSIGLADANLIETAPIDRFTQLEPASHLFWLYYPKVDGIQIRVQCGEESTIECGLKDADPEVLGIRVLTEHGYASLVDFSSLGLLSDEGSGPTTITLVYTDN